MNDKEKIHDLVSTIGKSISEARILLYKVIKQDIRAITGQDSIDLQEFHMEDGVDDPTFVLVEVDRHSGDMGCEIIDTIKIVNDLVMIDTESYGGLCIENMEYNELVNLYYELEYILSVKDEPDWDFEISGDKIVLKEER